MTFKNIFGTTFLLFVSLWGFSRQMQVTTLVKNINASGGVTADAQGNIYISDFGARLGSFDSTTNVYKWDAKTGQLSVFASGFKGASGACFDQEGNFFQSNPFGHSISKISKNGTANHNWATEGLKTPVGLEADAAGNIYVCNCGLNEIGKIDKEGKYSTFAASALFKCPNGLTQDDSGNFYACNFSDGNILKIDKQAKVSVVAALPALTGGANPVGSGHLVWHNGSLFVATIGAGEIYHLAPSGETTRIAGKAFAFSNADGSAEDATFNKPNGIAASITGDTLYINVSEPTWPANPLGLHPAHLRVITGVCSLFRPHKPCP